LGKPPPRWRERHARAPINIPANATLFGDMDILGYTYDAGNKLVKVTDIGNATYGFKDGANLTTEYLYDANGNLKTDANKNITAIQYNYLNLPTQVTINGQNILYVYDATGVKLRKTVNTTTTDYTGNFIYENNVLQFFNQPEGYVEISSPPSGELEGAYVYQYKDHLGNIRLSYKDISLTSTPSLQIVEENNYYPFGLKHKGYNNLQNGRDHNFGFGNKEEQEELGLSWIDITARNYDPALGRWMNVDPLAEQMRRHSPYNYAFDNPIYFIDNDGMAPAGFGGIVQFSKTPEPDDFVTKQTNNNDNKLIRELLADNRIIAGNFSQGSSGPGDPPKIFNSKTETAFGEDVVNQLDEVVVNGKSSGAQGGGGDLINPTGLGIRNDAGGQGYFGAPRGSRQHYGLDFQSVDGQDILSPISGRSVNSSFVNNKGMTIPTVVIIPTDPNLGFNKLELLYIGPVQGGWRSVNAGDIIGQSVNLQSLGYPGNVGAHIHLQMKLGKTPVNPTPYFFGH